MASLGVALIIKQTVMFEAAAIGLFALWYLWKAAGWKQVMMTGAMAVAIGLVPTRNMREIIAGRGARQSLRKSTEDGR